MKTLLLLLALGLTGCENMPTTKIGFVFGNAEVSATIYKNPNPPDLDLASERLRILTTPEGKSPVPVSE